MYREGLSFDRNRSEVSVTSVMAGVYGWMTFALAISGICAYLVGTTPNLTKSLLTGGTYWVLIIAEVVLVMVISSMINKMSAALATALFVAYSALNGITLGFIFLAYTMESIALTFFVTAGTFAVMAVIGTVTKIDLSKFGSIMLMALIGLIIASLVNMFIRSSALYWVCTYAGVLIFTGLTAYDVQTIKRLCYETEGEGFEVKRKVAIIGALSLYLDFVNLMLYLLRIFGGRKN
ncbi:MAG: Bax inhibitor-1/YccA family protein [Lentisphaeria bacterium]|nr:Bax inhibitor-1/YccA family protein [Lentisphaeria bacterium]